MWATLRRLSPAAVDGDRVVGTDNHGGMPTSRSSVSIEARADDVWDFVRDVTNLPTYVAVLSSAESAGGDAVRVSFDAGGETKVGEATFHVHDGHRRRVEWEVVGPDGYHGWLEVDREGEVASVTAEVHSDRGTADDLDPAVDAALFALKERIERG
jgi:uncharacterized membrane protein